MTLDEKCIFSRYQNARFFVVTLIERVTIRVSVFTAFFCSLRSLDGISRYISFNFG